MPLTVTDLKFDKLIGIGVGAGGSGRAVAPPGTRANSFSGQMLRFSGQ